MSLVFGRLEPVANFQEYRHLFQDGFPETAGTALETRAHYEWKYSRAGKSAPTFEFSASNSEATLGYYAALPLQYRIAGTPATGGLVCDVMTSSGARGRGVFTELGRYATTEMAGAGVDFVTGYPIRSYVFPGHLRVGWRIAFPLPVYAKIMNPALALRSRSLGWLGHLLSPVAAAHRRACRSSSQSAVCTGPSPADFFGSRQYSAFFARWSNSTPIHLARTPDFYNWRLRAPETAYQLSAAHDGEGATVGFAVTRSSVIQGIPVTCVVDFLALPGHAGVLHGDLEKISRQNRTAGLVFMTNPSTARRLALFRNGFVKTGIQFKLILKWLSSEPTPDHFWREPSWHLTWADTDNL